MAKVYWAFSTYCAASVVMYVCESWTIKKAEHQRIDVFELWCWRRLLRVSWTARRSNQSILKEISPEYSLEGLMLKLKLPILWLPDANNWLTGKDPDAGKDWRQEEKGRTEDEMVGRHHWLNEHEFEQAPGVSDGQGSLACCSPWVAKSRTRLRDWTELNCAAFLWTSFVMCHLQGPWASQVSPMVKNLPAYAREVRDTGVIRGLGSSLEGGNGNQLQ